ncbi:hypothetical protein [Leisingera aquaemixtae]|uniref:hypothetical protein n=1 Tax=Leisingera aquaemixtae TaxID=1396826 RepID=UPI0021A80309|nr:hypothetical protein [Leisingera aquaemixtae]UWQ45250.1 hypothetical protein K3719_15970 [Leisingera aquaemixtae]
MPGWILMHRESATMPVFASSGKAPDIKIAPWAFLRRLVRRFAAVSGLLLISSVPVFSQPGTSSIPENAHARSYGGGWECNLSYRPAGNTCVEIVVPRNAYPTNKPYGTGWECLHGYIEVESASCDKVFIPDGGYLDPTGKRWNCLRGYRKIDDICQEIALPENSYLTNDTSAPAWRCNRGFEAKGEKCLAIEVPEHAYLNGSRYGRPWTCERGFFEQDGTCAAVFVPENAFFDDAPYRSGWKCARGYEVSGERCILIDLPENAHLDRSGNRWECNKSFQRTRGRCALSN